MKQLIFLVFFINIAFFCQREVHQWTPLRVNEVQKMWYDNNQIRSISLPVFDIWILELHKTPLRIEGMTSAVVRTKTLYGVNLETLTYGIKEVVYYNINNSELKRFNYNLDEIEELSLKYPYPILEGSPLYILLGEISKKK